MNMTINEMCSNLDGMSTLLFGPDTSGTIWQSISGQTSVPNTNFYLYWLRTQWYNKLQRWMGQYLYKISIANTAVNTLRNFVLGNGFEYVSADSGVQRDIDDWLNYNNWEQKETEKFIKEIVEGESFLRVFNDYEVRFINPDFIFTDGVAEKEDYKQGILTDPMDYERPLKYIINYPKNNGGYKKEIVSADKIIHSKNAMGDERRGFSYLTPLYRQILAVDQLIHTNTCFAKLHLKYAVLKQWDVPKDAIQTLNQKTKPVSDVYITADGQTKPSNWDYDELNPREKDAPMNMRLELTQPNIPSEDIKILVNTLYRQLSTRLGIPDFCLTGDQSDLGAYNATLATNGYVDQALKQYQKKMKRDVMKLFKMCGFPTDKIEINTPKTTIVNRKEDAEIAQILVNLGISSRQTQCEHMDLDWDLEQERIDKEEPVEENPTLPEENINQEDR